MTIAQTSFGLVTPAMTTLYLMRGMSGVVRVCFFATCWLHMRFAKNNRSSAPVVFANDRRN